MALGWAPSIMGWSAFIRDVRVQILIWFQTFLLFIKPIFRLLMHWKAHLFRHFRLFQTYSHRHSHTPAFMSMLCILSQHIFPPTTCTSSLQWLTRSRMVTCQRCSLHSPIHAYMYICWLDTNDSQGWRGCDLVVVAERPHRDFYFS